MSSFLTVVDCTDIAAVDSEDESYNNEEMVTILSFFNDCTVQELGAVPGLSAKKAEKIIKMRPFDSWEELVSDRLHGLLLCIKYIHEHFLSSAVYWSSVFKMLLLCVSAHNNTNVLLLLCLELVFLLLLTSK